MSDSTHSAPFVFPAIAFIGGGNMASAIIGGMIRNGAPATRITVVEPFQQQRQRLREQFGVLTLAVASSALNDSELVVWAVKPQAFKDAAADVAQFAAQSLHLSVAAGIRTSTLEKLLGSEYVVRAMPNMPALIGLGMTGLFSAPRVDEVQKQLVERVIGTTGKFMWMQEESQLDAITALSGSGPAYVFYFLEAMAQAGTDMGLSLQQALQVAVHTFVGASQQAANSGELPATLRARVTSKGGTTHAALESMRTNFIAEHFIAAIRAAEHRASELADEFGL